MIRVTDQTLPLICLQAFGESDEVEVDEIRGIYERAYARGLPIVCISDARRASHSAEQRRMWADWTAQTMNDGGVRCTLATIVLLDSSLLRGALTALNWLAPPKVPQFAVPNVEEALDQARKVAEAAALDLPSHAITSARAWLAEGWAQQVG